MRFIIYLFHLLISKNPSGYNANVHNYNVAKQFLNVSKSAVHDPLYYHKPSSGGGQSRPWPTQRHSLLLRSIYFSNRAVRYSEEQLNTLIEQSVTLILWN